MIEKYQYWPYRIKYNFLTRPAFKVALFLLKKQVDTYIFVATTGRSGTATLNCIFDAIPGVLSLHEPYPIMNGEAMIRKNQGDPSLANFIYKNIKAINIRRMASGNRYYVETNHMFIKTFCDYVIDDFGHKVKVIHLVREPEKVAMSISSLNNYINCYPGTPQGNQWWLDYRAPGNIIKVADDLNDGAQYGQLIYRCLWYYYEIEARVKEFKLRYPRVPVFDIHINDLNEKSNVVELLKWVGIEYDYKSLPSNLVIHKNQKSGYKRELLTSEEEVRDMNSKFRRLLEERGYSKYIS